MKDLERNVWCLLGLPFDAIDMNGTVDRIYEAVRTRKKCFISTPNLNFLITSLKDDGFRDSVIHSDLSVVDGMPLLWLARMLNIPLPERVAGSDIIENLLENKNNYEPIKVFFFGGEDGVAEQACKKLKADEAQGVRCVGYYNPGFGSVDDMSTSEIISLVNKSEADFIIVSLGAKKGQEWIQKNISALDAPVISHLGAVVNFTAGTVKRAPYYMRRAGLEWLWRIKEEKYLWRRYFSDFIVLIQLFVTQVIPYKIYQLLMAKRSRVTKYVRMDESGDKQVFYISNYLISNEEQLSFDKALNGITINTDINIVIDKDVYLSSFDIGQLILLRKSAESKGNLLRISSLSSYADYAFKFTNSQYLLDS